MPLSLAGGGTSMKGAKQKPRPKPVVGGNCSEPGGHTKPDDPPPDGGTSSKQPGCPVMGLSDGIKFSGQEVCARAGVAKGPTVIVKKAANDTTISMRLINAHPSFRTCNPSGWWVAGWHMVFRACLVRGRVKPFCGFWRTRRTPLIALFGRNASKTSKLPRKKQL